MPKSANSPPPALARPLKPVIGRVIIERGRRLVHTGRDLWTWYPDAATELERFARARRWGVKSDTAGVHEFIGLNAEGDRMYRTHATVTLLVGREPGPTTLGRTSKGYTYRLVWDSSRTGLFELVRWERRTSTARTWIEFGSVGEVRSIIARNPVPPKETKTDG